MKKRVRRSIRFIFIISLLLILLLGYFIKITEKPPLNEIEFARKSIHEAKKAKADLYANQLIKESENLYDSAMDALRSQNEIFYIKRNYDLARKYAIQSSTKAIEANKITKLKSKNLKLYVQIKIDSVESYINDYKKIFVQLPVEKEMYEHFSIGNMLLAESKYAFKNKDYKLSEIKIDKAYKHLDVAFSNTRLILEKYFENYDNWISWVDDVIDKSKKEKRKAIIIDKFSKKIYVYKNGTLNYTSDIELGRNWVGNKNYSGDKTTPEGKYSIVKKIQTPHTKYYKALLIDYPNKDDLKRFNHAKKEGLIPKTAKIGGLIEIHGDGGKGTNWTDGCVALTDGDMNVVFSSAEIGTPVVIVGSLLQLKEIYN